MEQLMYNWDPTPIWIRMGLIDHKSVIQSPMASLPRLLGEHNAIMGSACTPLVMGPTLEEQSEARTI